ncbi:ParA family protein [Rhodococcus sp. BH5]|uniref:ParA family protein n=1 Tax=Rhodococcus sp. BH5 TaxID=2871702 RepID=UPI0022CD274E|nr:AAA family ATPase [Rhodococcus sp. BH5]MCZ9635211.1 AAA family ATPase [Rhodococcus sp. BH5]
MTVTAVVNLKGGVGKTTVTNGLAHAAAVLGRSCLVVDNDSQGNSTMHLTGHTKENPPEHSFADVLDRDVKLPIEDAIIPTKRPGIHILPSGFSELQSVQDVLVGKPGGEMAVQRALKSIRDSYEHVLIDCRPAIDLITRSAMYAADNVVVVVQPEPDAIEGFDSIQLAISDLAEFMDKDLKIAGIVVNQVDGRRNDHAKSLAYLREYVKASDIEILGDPIPMLTDISKLTNVGMGLDQHPKPTAKSRNLAENFATILKATR